MFQESGKINMGRFWRRLTVDAIESKDFSTAREIFNKMSPVCQDEPMSKYLMFRLSNFCLNRELAHTSILALRDCENSDQSRDLLYACVKDAQNSGDSICALEALKAIVTKQGFERGGLDQLLILLRSMVRLIHNITDGDPDGSKASNFANDLCTVFEAGMLVALAYSVLELTSRSRRDSKRDSLGQNHRQKYSTERARMVSKTCL